MQTFDLSFLVYYAAKSGILGNPRKAAPMNFSFFSSKRLIKSSKTSKLAAIPVEGTLAFTTVVRL